MNADAVSILLGRQDRMDTKLEEHDDRIAEIPLIRAELQHVLRTLNRAIAAGYTLSGTILAAVVIDKLG